MGHVSYVVDSIFVEPGDDDASVCWKADGDDEPPFLHEADEVARSQVIDSGLHADVAFARMICSGVNDAW